MAMTALKPVNRDPLKLDSLAWINSNPLAIISELSRPRSLLDSGAKAAFACHQLEQHSFGPGPEPCDLCGMITSGFCECCPTVGTAPTAVCHGCDQDGLVCHQCLLDGNSWEQSKVNHMESELGQMVEVSGIQLESGEFKRFPQILKIPVREVQDEMTGEISFDKVLAKIHEHAEQLFGQAANGTTQSRQFSFKKKRRALSNQTF